jgi:hypothetical protein
VRALVEGGAAPPRAIIVDSPLSSRVRWDALVAAAGPGTVAVLVEVTCSDAALWRARVEARGRADAGTRDAHKPATWAALTALVASYGGADAWPDGVSGASRPWAARVGVDSAVEGAAGAAARVMAELGAAGVVRM